MHPEVLAFLKRLRTIPEYAQEEFISLVQAHRRIKDGKAEKFEIRGKPFVLLPEKKD